MPEQETKVQDSQAMNSPLMKTEWGSQTLSNILSSSRDLRGLEKKVFNFSTFQTNKKGKLYLMEYLASKKNPSNETKPRQNAVLNSARLACARKTPSVITNAINQSVPCTLTIPREEIISKLSISTGNFL